MKTTAGVLAYVLACALFVAAMVGCASMKAPQSQALLNSGISAASAFGCAQISAADAPAALAELGKVDKILTSDPVGTYNYVILAAKAPPLAWIWNALHEVLDPITGIVNSEWTAFAQAGLKAAVDGCRAGIGTSA